MILRQNKMDCLSIGYSDNRYEIKLIEADEFRSHGLKAKILLIL